MNFWQLVHMINNYDGDAITKGTIIRTLLVRTDQYEQNRLRDRQNQRAIMLWKKFPNLEGETPII